MARFIVHVLCLSLVCVFFHETQGQSTLTKKVNNTSTHTNKVITLDKDNEFTEVRKYWISADKALKGAMGKMIKTAMPMVMREIYTRNISTNCLNGLLQFTTALKRIKLWAFEMLDASGKLPEGFLAGTLTTIGDYQECVNIFVNESKLKMQGQYCTLEVNPPLPPWKPFISMHIPASELTNISAPSTVISHLSKLLHNLYVVRIKWGVCIPSLCSKNDLQSLLQIVPEKSGIDWKFDVMRCETKQTLHFTYTQNIILIVFGVLAILLGVGTLVDLIFNVESKTIVNSYIGTALQYIRSFSVFYNIRKLALHSCPYDNLRFINGIIFICIFWTLISNAFMFVNYDIASNIVEALHVTKLLIFEILLNRMIPIQTFFFLSGFVAAYKWMRTPEKELSIWKYVLKRYWRYTPTYVLMICLIMLTPFWGSGPSWNDHLIPVYNKCYNTWWANLLYINNFLDMDSSCLNHTWIFAVDAQLHLFGLLILIPLKRRPSVGLMLNFVLIGASLLTVALTNVYYDLPPGEMTSFLNEKDRAYFASHTYFRIYTHFCMYCSGIATGYFVTEKPKFKISKIVSVVIWFIVVATGLSVLCIVHVWKNGDLPAPLIGAIYAVFSKVGWAAALAWIAVTCASGNGGGLNDFLSWKPFVFLARLAFTAYIVHPILIEIFMAFKKSHLHLEQFEFIYSIMAHALSTHILAYFCYLAFEAPFLSVTEVARNKMEDKSAVDFNSTESRRNSSVCNGVMTEKPMKYEDKRKLEEKLKENGIHKTKF